jgi:hypothetical protein
VISLKQLHFDLVNIVWLINLTSLIPVILTEIVKAYYDTTIILEHFLFCMKTSETKFDNFRRLQNSK